MTSGLVALCAQHNVGILAYGVLAGGFLTDAWLRKEKPSVEVCVLEMRFRNIGLH